MLITSLNSTHLWSARRSQTTKMEHLLPQFCPVLVVCCFCMLQIPPSGVAQPLADPPDSLDMVELEQLVYFLNQGETLSSQPKENQNPYKRFLFHYSRAQKPPHPANSEFAPVHPLMRLAAKLASGRMKRLLRSDSGKATVDFPNKACEPCENAHFPNALERRAGKTFDLECDYITVCVFVLQDRTTSLGRPFFLFRPRNGRYSNNRVQ
ncbi:neuromedin-S [Psammomys obesus]|uniref:neuromedin-S n=1 Tax=Psammomys obesus TaxID=48139 RepID=UPI002452D76A|nr:neuromedin-S [Psammomys obesus]